MKNLNEVQKEILKRVTDYTKWNKLRKEFIKANKEHLKLNNVQKIVLKADENNESRYELKKAFKAMIKAEA